MLKQQGAINVIASCIRSLLDEQKSIASDQNPVFHPTISKNNNLLWVIYDKFIKLTTKNLTFLLLQCFYQKNHLSKVDEDMFQYLTDLRGLNLTENLRLNSIATSSFDPFASTLYRLSFDKCSFTNLDPAVINKLEHNNLFIWAGDNPWICNCNLEVENEITTYFV